MEKIKRLIKANVPDVDSKIQSVATELGFTNLAAISDTEAALIADEVTNRNSGKLATPEGQKFDAKNAGKKKMAESQTVNPGMKEVIDNSIQGSKKLIETVDNFYSKFETDSADRIVDRAKLANSNILGLAVARLQEEAENTGNFCIELGNILEEAYSRF